MAILTWSETYSVRVAQIDAQHQKLISLINELHDAMSQGKGKAVIGQTLDSLIAYANTHFATEERLMAEYAYPGLLRHQNEHQAFTQKVLEFQEQYRQGRAALTVEVMAFLKDWLVNHIQGSDKKYSQHLNDRGVN